MGNVTVIGAQWGDEGKGKIVDWLASRADMVVRFQGGHNAGHTLVVGDRSTSCRCCRAGSCAARLSVIGNGVVLDPWALKARSRSGSRAGRVDHARRAAIAETCPLILPIHRDLDALREDASGAGKIGTTRRGIGPAYEDKVGRRAIRVCDLAHLDELDPQLDRLCAHHDALARRLRRAAGRPRALKRRAAEIADFVLPFARPVWRDLDEALARGKRILFEGAQGVLLDVDHGTYPFVTSSNTVAGTTGPGQRHRPVGAASCSASSRPTPPASAPARSRPSSRTRSASGSASAAASSAPSPGASAAAAGSTRCWCASPAPCGRHRHRADQARRARRLRTSEDLHRLRLGGAGLRLSARPRADQARVEPIYEEMDGWQRIDRGRAQLGELPAQAIKYIRRVEELIRCPVALVAPRPEREDTILVRDPFAG
jgi:adenylosuccinate synthase